MVSLLALALGYEAMFLNPSTNLVVTSVNLCSVDGCYETQPTNCGPGETCKVIFKNAPNRRNLWITVANSGAVSPNSNEVDVSACYGDALCRFDLDRDGVVGMSDFRQFLKVLGKRRVSQVP